MNDFAHYILFKKCEHMTNGNSISFHTVLNTVIISMLVPRVKCV